MIPSTPMLILGALVLGTLVWKGYIPIPSLARRPLNPAPGTTAIPPAFRPGQFSELLAGLDSGTLGFHFALAKRREAEAKLANTIAEEAGASIEQRFTAPFSGPPGEGSDAGSGGN